MRSTVSLRVSRPGPLISVEIQPRPGRVEEVWPAEDYSLGTDLGVHHVIHPLHSSLIIIHSIVYYAVLNVSAEFRFDIVGTTL